MRLPYPKKANAEIAESAESAEIFSHGGNGGSGSRRTMHAGGAASNARGWDERRTRKQAPTDHEVLVFVHVSRRMRRQSRRPRPITHGARADSSVRAPCLRVSVRSELSAIPAISALR